MEVTELNFELKSYDLRGHRASEASANTLLDEYLLIKGTIMIHDEMTELYIYWVGRLLVPKVL